MRDNAHPFPFDAQAEIVMKTFMQATGEKLNRAQRQVSGGDNVQRFSHGGSWQSHHSYDPRCRRSSTKQDCASRTSWEAG